jgi:hypothetical protein
MTTRQRIVLNLKDFPVTLAQAMKDLTTLKSEHDTSLLYATAELFEKLSPYLEFHKVPAQTRFNLYEDGTSYCYFVRDGWFSIHHSADPVLLGTLQLPGIIGIGGAIPESAGLYIESKVESEVAISTVPEMHALINELDLWEMLSKHIFRMTGSIFTKGVLLTGSTSYEIMRFHLLELINEPDAIRNSTVAATYVQQKTRLSRSTIMKILAQLKQGGYVTLENGILKEVHKLPLKY